MLCAARLITVVDAAGREYATVEARPYTPELDPSVWTVVEADSPLDVVYEDGAIRALTSEEKLARHKASRVELLKLAGKEVVYTHAPEHRQANAALGVYDQATADLIRVWIQAVRAVVNEKEAAINGAADRASADAVDVSYDAIYAAAWNSLTAEQQQGLLGL